MFVRPRPSASGRTTPKRARRIGGQFVADALAWVLALVAAVALRYDFEISQVSLKSLALLCVSAVLVQLAAGWLSYLYRARHPRGSFAELSTLVVTVAVTAAVVGVPVLLAGTILAVPRSAVIIAAPIALVIMGGVRYVRRLVSEGRATPSEDAVPVLVYGAGTLGAQLVRRMLREEGSHYLPVGVIDDDPGKKHMRLNGVPVVGTGNDLVRAQAATGARQVVVAVAQADATLLRRISDAARAANLRIKVLPLLDETLSSDPGDLRDVSIEDLIGRHPVDTAIETIASYLTGRRVLVTGAGGSIGSELCRQIAKFSPAELILLDRDETGLQGTQILLSGHGLLDTNDIVLADIRDRDALMATFRARRPEVIFHAAALKHLPMLEQYPEEAWKTNVLGTRNVLDAALDVGVTTFINISTDKAANASSVLGHSKRLSERLTAWAGAESGKTYLSVRFGNVIGSRGSMLPTFAALIEAGGPVTVTHPDVTRYFMTIPEACQLVVQAGAIGAPGEILILDMGEPVRILDVANRMIQMSGKEVPIVFTGLRKGEKLHEVLTDDEDVREHPVHPKISHTTAVPLPPGELEEAAWMSLVGGARLPSEPTRD